MYRLLINCLLFFLPLLFQGCAALLGIKTPTEISKSTSIDYLLKHNIDTSNVVYLKEHYFDTLRSLPFKPGWEKGLRPIQFKIFNNDGNLIFHYSSCEGPLKYSIFFDQFPPENITPMDFSYNLARENSMIESEIPMEANKDYITIIYWATYTGIPGRRLIKRIEKEFKLKNVSTSIVKLNIDNIRSIQ